MSFGICIVLWRYDFVTTFYSVLVVCSIMIPSLLVLVLELEGVGVNIQLFLARFITLAISFTGQRYNLHHIVITQTRCSGALQWSQNLR